MTTPIIFQFSTFLGWTELPDAGSFVPFDFSSKSLQLQFETTPGSGDSITIKFKTGSDTYDIGFMISFLNPPRYRISSCGDFTEFTNPAITADGIWTFTYTTTSLLLFFDSEQVNEMSMSFEAMVFI